MAALLKGLCLSAACATLALGAGVAVHGQVANVPEPQRTGDILDSIQLCMDAVDEATGLDQTVFEERGWRSVEPRISRDVFGATEVSFFLKDGLAIRLEQRLPKPSTVDCSAQSVVRSSEHIDEIRQNLITELGAVPLSEAEGLDAWKAEILKLLNHQSDKGPREVEDLPLEIENYLIIGPYMIELGEMRDNRREKVVIMLSASSFLIPDRYRNED